MIDARFAACLALLLAACGQTPIGASRVVAIDASQPPPARENFAALMLSRHNDARGEAGQPPLRWNDALASGAYSWARTIAADGEMRHSPRSSREGMGENLWMGTADFFTLEHMIDVMIDERRYFRPGIFPEVSSTGRWEDVAHYTQIVWPTTTEVGCALATENDRDALVCRYWPNGNIIGRPIG